MAEMLDPALPPEAHNAEQDDAPAQAQTVAGEALHSGAQDALNASDKAPAPAYDPLADAGGEPDLVDRMDQMVSSGVIDMDAYRGERSDDDEDMALGPQASDDDFPRGAQ